MFTPTKQIAKTAFTLHYRMFSFKNAILVLQRPWIISPNNGCDIIAKKCNSALVYVNDTIHFSRNADEHILYVRPEFSLLHKAGRPIEP